MVTNVKEDVLSSLPSLRRQYPYIATISRQREIFIPLRWYGIQMCYMLPTQEETEATLCSCFFSDAATIIIVNLYIRSFAKIDDVKMVSHAGKENGIQSFSAQGAKCQHTVSLQTLSQPAQIFLNFKMECRQRMLVTGALPTYSF